MAEMMPWGACRRPRRYRPRKTPIDFPTPATRRTPAVNRKAGAPPAGALMSDIETSNWSEAAASNNAAPPNGMPEAMAPSGVNDSGREIMAAIKREWDRSHPTVTSGGSANAQTLSYSVNPTALTQGQVYSFIAGFTNTGAATLQVGSLTAKTLKLDGQGLLGGEVAAGNVITA